jgi:hypothetical protein
MTAFGDLRADCVQKTSSPASRPRRPKAPAPAAQSTATRSFFPSP